MRSEPFAGTPYEAMRAGWCPGCGGTGRVQKVVPIEGTYVCSTCNGGGTVEAVEAVVDAMLREDGLL